MVNQEPRTFVSREEVTGNFTDLSPEQQRAANDAGVVARTAALNSGAGVREANIAQRRARTNTAIDFLRDIQTFSDPDEEFGPPRGSIRPDDLSSYNTLTAGEQLAGLDAIGGYIGRNSVEFSPSVQDFLDEHGMSRKELMDNDFSRVPNGAVLPSGPVSYTHLTLPTTD